MFLDFFRHKEWCVSTGVSSLSLVERSLKNLGCPFGTMDSSGEQSRTPKRSRMTKTEVRLHPCCSCPILKSLGIELKADQKYLITQPLVCRVIAGA